MEKIVGTANDKMRNNNGKRKGEGEPSNFRLSRVSSFSEDDAWRLDRSVPRMYSIFTFGLLHNLHIGISKLLKEAAASYLGCVKLSAREAGQPHPVQKSIWSKRCVLREFNAFFKCIVADCDIHVVMTHF